MTSEIDLSQGAYISVFVIFVFVGEEVKSSCDRSLSCEIYDMLWYVSLLCYGMYLLFASFLFFEGGSELAMS